jgi:hypothetical protein
MGFGLIAGALSGAGDSIARSAGDYQRFNDTAATDARRLSSEESLAKMREDLRVEAANRIAEGELERSQAPLLRFQKIASKYAGSDAATAPASAPVGVTDESGIDAPTLVDTSGGWDSINASVRSTQPERNAAQAGLMEQELAGETDPELAAVRTRELANVAPGAAAPAGAVAATAGGKMGAKDAMRAALEDAKLNDPLAYKAAIEAFKGEHVLVGPSGSLVNPVTNEVGYHNEAGAEIAKVRADALRDVADKRINATDRLSQMKADAAAKKTAVDPADVEDMAQRLATYAKKPLGDRVIGTPYGIAVMKRVAELNPDWSDIRYGTIDKATKAFSTGKQGDTVRSLNTSVDHIGTARTLVDALKNGDMQPFNKMGNYLGVKFGGTAASNFEAVQQIVAAEINKSVVGAAGTGEERAHMAAQIGSMKSPEQLYGVLDKFTELMAGQLKSLRIQYKQGTGNDDFDENFLSPAARAAFNHVGAPAATPHSKPVEMAATAVASGPKVGAIENGYRFKGGDAGQASNWEKI